ncbi:hypothetical protein BYT27DRAFT_7250068 [Phlegmacium glaucopus]|nr:hypothetical protein BYT27DRAFT_7250068 [Phlegmacium glaucopus]
MSNAWAETTQQSYSAGLLVFHVFCDMRLIPEHQRAPASPVLLSAFVASLASTYSHSAVSNYLYGLRAWHLLHGVAWDLNEPEIETLLKGADRVAPALSKRKKRRPFTTEYIEMIQRQLDMTNHLDTAVLACLTTCFYAAARLGEFTVPRLEAFNPSSYVTTANLRTESGPNHSEVTVLHIPRMKAAPTKSEDVYWSCQQGLSDPYHAMEHHKQVNNPPATAHLFAYRHKDGHRPLTKQAFIKHIAAAARVGGEEPLQGHGIRIGATLLYLLRGVPIEAVKVMGSIAANALSGRSDTLDVSKLPRGALQVQQSLRMEDMPKNYQKDTLSDLMTINLMESQTQDVIVMSMRK